MKKFITVLAILLMLCFICESKQKTISYENEEEINLENEIYLNESKEDEFKENEYTDLNPIKLGIYASENGKRFLQTTYTNTWQYHKDINTFNIFYTQEEEIENTAIRICYGEYLKNYDEDIISQYRNGFHVRFSITEGIVDKTILSPKDTEEFYDFLEIYLYDSYHRKAGEWYSHTTENDFDENTTLTSIKLTAGKRINEITSDIELIAFSYDDDDFDINGNYKGVSKYSITVKKREK